MFENTVNYYSSIERYLLAVSIFSKKPNADSSCEVGVSGVIGQLTG